MFKKMLYTLIAILLFCVVNLESFSHDAVVAYDNTKDYLYFVRDGIVYWGDIPGNTITPIHVVDATDAVIQLSPNGDALIIRELEYNNKDYKVNFYHLPSLISVYDLKQRKIAFKFTGLYSEQPFSPNGRYFVYNNTDDGALKKIDLVTMQETIRLENVDPNKDFYYGWDNDSVIEFYVGQNDAGEYGTYYKRWVADTIVEDIRYAGRGYYGKGVETFLGKNYKDVMLVTYYLEQHYVAKTGISLCIAGEYNCLNHFTYKYYHQDTDFYCVSNDRQKSFLFGGGGSNGSGKYNSIRTIKVHDMYENYELDYSELDYLLNKDIIYSRIFQNCQFDSASKNMLIIDHIDSTTDKVNWYSIYELMINQQINIIWKDQIPEFSISKIKDYCLY